MPVQVYARPLQAVNASVQSHVPLTTEQGSAMLLPELHIPYLQFPLEYQNASLLTPLWNPMIPKETLAVTYVPEGKLIMDLDQLPDLDEEAIELLKRFTGFVTNPTSLFVKKQQIKHEFIDFAHQMITLLDICKEYQKDPKAPRHQRMKGLESRLSQAISAKGFKP